MQQENWADLQRHVARAKTFLAALALPLAMPVLASAQDASIGWGLNSFGGPGLVDMPGAHSRADGAFELSISHFRNQTRTALTFQISERLSGSFRYSLLYNIRTSVDPATLVYDHVFDRSFSLHYKLRDEGKVLPAMAVGISDIVGTSLYAGEYIVATKTLTPRLRATIGMGWGRLGSYGGFSNPLGVISDGFLTREDAGEDIYDNPGGQFHPDIWFHGDAAFFAGVEWMASERLRLVAEYSSDAYEREDGNTFDWKSPFNFSADYALSPNSTLSARYLYGSEFGLQFSYSMQPTRPKYGSGRDPAPPPVVRTSDLTKLALAGGDLESRAQAALAREGLELEGLETSGKRLSVQIRNSRYGIAAQALGRAARVLTHVAPPTVDSFDIRLASDGMPVSSTVVQRADMETLEFHPVASDLARARVRIADAPVALPPLEGRWPIFNWNLDPYISNNLFDPDNPARLDFGMALKARYEPLPGVVIEGRINQKVIGNLDQGDRPSNSVLPHVRSDSYLYQKYDTTLAELTGAWYFRPGHNLYGRVTAGILETMYGGVSTEVLWKPQNSSLALGVEVNHVKQRDFDQQLSFRDYSVTTGHLSAYYEFASGYTGQLDVGRYLAGDVGATVTMAREFDNGWKVGAFATKTNVSSADFGEGSFDKGIFFTIPLEWTNGKPNTKRLDTVIRPVLRDGGARVSVPGRLYEGVRAAQASEIDASWGRFWK